MADEHHEAAVSEEETGPRPFRVGATALCFILGAILIVLFATVTEYDESADKMPRYTMFQDVHVMIFIGFGFLMCFLYRSGFTATGHAFLLAALGVLWALLVRGFWFAAMSKGPTWSTIKLGLPNLIFADFCVGGCLISFGALIGRVSAEQLVLMTFWEIILFEMNEAFLVQILRIADIGGSIIIHLFGAVFGLSVSFVLGKIQKHTEKDCSHNKANAVTDTMAMVGTLFLFCFWPSFNAAMAGPTNASAQQRAVVNTYLGICSSAFVAFLVCTAVYKGKFRMVEVQNSTLAGGVALGAIADMYIQPYMAVLIGGFAGAVSVLGYRFLQAKLEAEYGLKDTCGILNLHGMPALIGAVASVFFAREASADVYGAQLIADVFEARHDRTGATQAGYQLAAIVFTIAVAIIGGALVGAMMCILPSLVEFYDDRHEYVIEEEPKDEHTVHESPHYFSHHDDGETHHHHHEEHHHAPEEYHEHHHDPAATEPAAEHHDDGAAAKASD